jgi:hypothetical protein
MQRRMKWTALVVAVDYIVVGGRTGGGEDSDEMLAKRKCSKQIPLLGVDSKRKKLIGLRGDAPLEMLFAFGPLMSFAWLYCLKRSILRVKITISCTFAWLELIVVVVSVDVLIDLFVPFILCFQFAIRSRIYFNVIFLR